MIDEWIEQGKNVSVTLIDKSTKKGIITRYEPSAGLIEFKGERGVFVIPLTSVLQIYYEK